MCRGYIRTKYTAWCGLNIHFTSKYEGFEKIGYVILYKAFT